MKAKEAQEERAHGLHHKCLCVSRGGLEDGGRGRWHSTYMPHIATRVVAKRREVTKGARAMEPAKTRCESIHAVARSGFSLLSVLTSGAMLAGGRGVKQGFFSSSGDLMTQGRRTDPAKVMMEKAMRERLPTRPMSPSVSFDSRAVCGAS